MNLLAIIPLPYRIGLYALIAVALVGFGWVKGANHVQDEWSAEKLEQKVIVARVKQQQPEITAQVITKYVDRIQIVKTKGAEIIKEVPIYVSSNSCPMSGGFRVFHDAAACGTTPDPTSIANAPPVPAQDVAETVAANYQQCRETSEQLIALQEWVTRQISIPISSRVEVPP